MIETFYLPTIDHLKLLRPPVTEDYVPRPHLLKILERINIKPLTLVVAPAGYGKTTLLSHWLENCSCPSAWISLDEDDNQPANFLANILAAIRGLFPEYELENDSLIESTDLPPAEVIFCILAKEIDRVDTDFVLVMDDYHRVLGPQVHEVFGRLIHRAHRAMHLVITSRHDPPLPLITYRAQNLLAELRAADLRFSKHEISVFIEQAHGIHLDDQAIDLLMKKTEGWPVGVRLAALSLRHAPSLDNRLAALLGDNRYIMEYLISEVLERLPSPVQDFLLKTSLLDKFCAELCDAVVGTVDPSASNRSILDWLDDNDLFISPLETDRRWFRYHPLFQEFLQNRLKQQSGPDEIAGLYRRASDWYAQNNLIEEAIDAALAGEDVRLAVDLIRRRRHELMARGQWTRLEGCLQKFPSRQFDQEPELLLTEIWLNVAQWNLPKAWIILERFQALLHTLPLADDEIRQFKAEADILLAVKMDWALEFDAAIEHAQSGLAVSPPEWYFARSFAWLHMAIALQAVGEGPRAHQVLSAARFSDFFCPYGPAIRSAVVGCFVYWMDADLISLHRTAKLIIEFAGKHDLLESLGWGWCFQGTIDYEQNNFPAAVMCFEKVVERPYLVHPVSFIISSYYLALIYLAQGLNTQSQQAGEMAFDFSVQLNNPHLQRLGLGVLARMAIQNGDIDQALSLNQQIGIGSPYYPRPFFFAVEMVLPHLLLAQGTPESLLQAKEVLAQLNNFCQSIHNTRYLIETLALQAMVYQALCETGEALQSLRAALDLSRTGNIIRPYLDLGRPMHDLLSQLHRQEPGSAYLAQILAAYPPHVSPKVLEKTKGIIEPLTERELQILSLLSQRLSNKEIANQLFISPITVKRHTINIYQKLSVNSRRQAVTSAAELGLIAPPVLRLA